MFDALDAVVSRACELSFDALTTPERLRLLECLERVSRRLLVPQHTLINQLAEQAAETELGGWLPRALADRLHITRSEANRPGSLMGGIDRRIAGRRFHLGSDRDQTALVTPT